MTDYIVDMETLERAAEHNEDQADLFTRKANRYKRLLASKEEIYNHKLLSEHYAKALKNRAKELGLADKIELKSISFVGKRLEASYAAHYTLYINDNHVASFHSNLRDIEATLEKVLDKLEEVVRSAKISARRLEADVYDIVGYESE